MNALFISECKNYKSLTDSTRKLNECLKASCLPVSTRDDRLKTLYKIYNGYKSVDWQGEAWYRVMGEAGTRIPEAPFTTDILIASCCCPVFPNVFYTN